MAGIRIELELAEELFEQLTRVADSMGLGDPAEAALIGLAEWISRRKSELDDRNPDERYFINEALDDLLAHQGSRNRRGLK